MTPLQNASTISAFEHLINFRASDLVGLTPAEHSNRVATLRSALASVRRAILPLRNEVADVVTQMGGTETDGADELLLETKFLGFQPPAWAVEMALFRSLN